MSVTTLVSQVAWQMFIKRRNFARDWQTLDAFATISPAEARRAMSRRLLAQVQHFGARADALPEWRAAAKISDPDELWHVWPELPIVSKRDLQQRFSPQEMAARFGLEGEMSSTGGSTGEPTPYFHDRDMLRVVASGSLYCRQKQGWWPGMATVTLWGSERDIGKARTWRGQISSRLRNQWLVAGYAMRPETAQHVYALVQAHAPVAIYGFTSMLDYVARELARAGKSAAAGQVVTAWNGGEMLYPEQAARFAQVFGVPILNHYGGRELGAMAYQPRAHAPLTVLRPFLHLEIVNEAGRPAQVGEAGRLLWTSTVCRGTPFLRYEIGDLGEFAAADVDESGIRQIRNLHGRSAGLIRLPDGRTVNNLYWNHLFKEFWEVEQFQVVVQGEANALELRLRGTPFSAVRERELLQILRGFLHTVPVTIRWVDELPRTAQGKLMQVVHEQ